MTSSCMVHTFISSFHRVSACLGDAKVASSRDGTLIWEPPIAPGGRSAKDHFTIDVDSGTATCTRMPGTTKIAAGFSPLAVS
ncbi:MAG: hypothetical protein ACRDTN_19000 [Mycobacterium sp.]